MAVVRSATVLDTANAKTANSWAPVTKLPNQPLGAKGVLDIRGSIVQVYDLVTLLGGRGGDSESKRQVVLVVSLKANDIGLLADSMSDIIFAKGEELRPAPKGGRGDAGCVSGLVKNDQRLIIILDLKALLLGESAEFA